MENIQTDLFKIEDCFTKTEHILSISIIDSQPDFEPMISIAIPTYKRPELLKEALYSALNQINYDNFEVIVVDNNPIRDCETEQMLKKINNKRLSYYKNAENIGMFDNWNRCITLSKGKYITILNDDDKLENTYIASVIDNVLKKEMDALLVGYQYIDSYNSITSRELKKGVRLSRLVPLDLFSGNVNPGSLGILFLKENLLKIGGFNSKYYPSADYLFLVIFLLNSSKVYYINKVLADYRISINESLKPSTIQGFIDMDKRMRRSFVNLYPHLKPILNLADIAIELKQIKSLSCVSEESREIYKNEIQSLQKKVHTYHSLALRSISLICKIQKMIGIKI